MSNDLYLIAHKVRSEPAFDIATQIPCPECGIGGPEPTCSECDGEGFWWIVPTSGHRAYPYWNIPLGALMHDTAESFPLIDPERTLDVVPVMPSSCPDHYTTRASPARPSLASLLAIPRPTLKVDRRF